MKKIFNKLFRYKFSSICIILLFAFAYLAFYYGGYENYIKENERNDSIRYIYNHTKAYTVASNLGDEIIGELFNLNEEGVNISISDFTVYVDSRLASALVEIQISGVEYCKYPVISGGFPSEEELSSGERVVVAGKKLKKYTTTVAGKDYLKILGEEYRVTGYVSAEASGIYDNLILVFAGNLGVGFNKALSVGLYSGNISLYMESDDADAIKRAEEKVEGLSDGENVYFQSQYSPKFMSTEVNGESYKGLSVLIYLFCIISIIYAVDLWMVEREREVIIRKIYGESTRKIIWKIYKELFALMFFAGIFAVGGQLVIDYFSREVMAYSLEKMWFIIQRFVLCIVITSLLVMIKPVFVILNKKPSVLLSTTKRR